MEITESENPNYFAIIPADVRYDKNLKANEKLLYGELTCLSNKLGYCFSSNSYFAELYDVTPQAVSGWIANLSKRGYIDCEYLHNGTEVKERRIRITTKSKKLEKGKSKKLYQGINKTLKGYKENFKDNNTSNNNININNTSMSEYTEVVKTYFNNFKKLYEQNLLLQEKPVFGDVAGNTIKRMLRKLSKDDLIKVLNNAMNDEWIISTGYSIMIIFSEKEINKLLNVKPQQNSVQDKNVKSDMPSFF